MKYKPEKKYVQIGIMLFLTAIAIMGAYLLFFRINEIGEGISKINHILAPIFYGFVLAYLMTPLLNLIEKRCFKPFFDRHKLIKNTEKRNKFVRLICVFFTVLIVVALLYLFFSSVIPQLYSSIQSLVSHYSVYSNNLVNWINMKLDANPEIALFLSDIINDYSSEADDFLNDIVLPAAQSFLLPDLSSMLSSISASIIKVLSFAWNIIIGLIISIYVLLSKERFTQGFSRLCYAFMETKSANKFIDAVRFTHRTFIGFLGGKVIDSIIIGIICYFSCLILKIPYAVLISVIIGVTNIIPIFGPYIGGIPSTLIILLVDPKKALTFIIFILILQQVDGNYIGPKILSQSTGLSSFWIISSITFFGGLMGFIGMVIGVPITAVIASGIETVTKSHLDKKNLPIDPESYLDVGEIKEDGSIVKYVDNIAEEKNKNRNQRFCTFKEKLSCTFKSLKSIFIKKKS